MKLKWNWPTAIALIYGLFFIVLVSVVIISMFSRGDLVSRDYYRREINYQRQIDKERRTGALERPIEVRYSREEKKLFIVFPKALNMKPESGTIVLFRPSDARQDQRFPLLLNSEGYQVIDLSRFTGGNWRVKVEWEFQADAYYHEEKIII